MNAIEVLISDRQGIIHVPDSLVRSAVLHALRSSSVNSGEVSVAILDDAQIREVHREFLGHDCATDTISFRLDRQEASASFAGEVLVSAETAARAATTADWPAAHELLLYVVHATLHLVGFDDQEPKARAAMRQREREVLAALEIEMPQAAEVDK